jgi:hypothetical protein
MKTLRTYMQKNCAVLEFRIQTLAKMLTNKYAMQEMEEIMYDGDNELAIAAEQLGPNDS